MAEAGRRRVTDTLAWDHSVAPLLAAYDQAFQRPEGRGASAAGHRSPQPRA
jgi:hypothetical protein